MEAQGFWATAYTSIDDAMGTDFTNCKLIVCDLMMPKMGHFPSTSKRSELLTGLSFVEHLREIGVQVPCAILTNLNIDHVYQQAVDAISTMEDVVLVRKHDFNPIEFSRIAFALVNREAISDISPKLGRKIADSIVLRPTFFGVGVDLKKLFGAK